MSDATESELACPAESDSLLASTNLPPTPNNAVCDCVNGGALGCHAIAATASKPAVIGSLIDYTCSLLGQINSSVTCEASIGGNGTTGVYGPLSMCSPEIKLNWAMSAYWVATNRVETSCDFSGNATLNANVSQTSADITQVAENCLNNVPSVSTPSATDTPVTSPTGTTASPSSGTSSTTTKKPSANFASAVGVSAFDVVGAAVVAIFLGATIA
jgi:hypothetical protein